MPSVNRTVHEISSPGWRIAAAVASIGGIFLLAYGLQLQGVLEAAATIAAVAAVHLIGTLGRTRSEGAAPIEGRVGTILASFTRELPWLAPWIGRGSGLVELLKGLGHGVVVLTGQTVITGLLTTMGVGEALARSASIVAVVAAIHLVGAYLSQGRTAESGLSRIARDVAREVPILSTILLPQPLHIEAAKGLVKGLVVLLGRGLVVALAGFLTSWYLAAGVAALVVAAIIMPSAVTRVVAALKPKNTTPTSESEPTE